MKRTTQTIVALAVVGITAATMASLARADVVVSYKGGTPPYVLARFPNSVPSAPGGGCSNGECGPYKLFAGDEHVCYCPGNTFPNAYVGVAGMDAGGTAYKLVYCFGSAEGGPQLGTSTLPDSMVACVGLYKNGPGSGGLHNLYPPSTNSSHPEGTGVIDSAMVMTVDRTVAGQITLGFPHGGMQARSVNYHIRSRSSYTVIVYPDTVTANADDALHTGAGAVFYGKVILKEGPDKTIGGGPYQTRELSNLSGNNQKFLSSDFIFTTEAGGNKANLRPSPGLTKVVTGVNEAQATIVELTDPNSDDAVPATSPIGLILLALALAGSGLWAIRLRRKAVEA